VGVRRVERLRLADPVRTKRPSDAGPNVPVECSRVAELTSRWNGLSKWCALPGKKNPRKIRHIEGEPAKKKKKKKKKKKPRTFRNQAILVPKIMKRGRKIAGGGGERGRERGRGAR